MKRVIYWFRDRRAVAKWNKDISLIMEMAKHHRDGHFYWSQLVWQEVHMYILLAKQVEQVEFEELCRRRGFDAMMRAYLVGMLKYVGLGRNLICGLGRNLICDDKTQVSRGSDVDSSSLLNIPPPPSPPPNCLVSECGQIRKKEK